MKIYKILLPFLVCLFAFANENPEIVDLFDDIKKINLQLRILNSDANATDAKLLENKKYELLSRVPKVITNISFSDDEVNKFHRKKDALQKMLKNSSNKQSSTYFKNAIALENLNINEIFFKGILSLEELFKKGAKAHDIRGVIQDSLIEFKTSVYARIKDLKDSAAEGFAAELDELENTKQTSEEILNYLSENAELLSSSLLINELNLNSAIDTINEKIAFKVNGINFGKTTIIIVVFLLFVSLTKILAKVTYIMALSFFSKYKYIDDIKDEILHIIKKPISSLIITYAFKICIAIGYYPYPMPLWIANLFSIIYIVLLSWFCITILNGYGMLLLSKLAKKSGRKEVVNLILKIVYFIIIIIALLLVLSRLGFDISAIIASLGIGGLAVAFAAKDIIANFFASVMLLFDNSFSQGDLINCKGIEGTIVEIGLRKTTIRSADNALIFVPNSTLASEAIVNWSRRKIGRMINMTIALTYDSKPEALRKCIADITDMLSTHPDISRADNGGTFKPNSRMKFKENMVSIDDLVGYKSVIYVSLDALNDSSIDIAVTCFSKEIARAEYVKVKQDVIFKIIDIVTKNGLEFAFPSQSLYLQNSGENKFIEK